MHGNGVASHINQKVTGGGGGSPLSTIHNCSAGHFQEFHDQCTHRTRIASMAGLMALQAAPASRPHRYPVRAVSASRALALRLAKPSQICEAC